MKQRQICLVFFPSPCTATDAEHTRPSVTLIETQMDGNNWLIVTVYLSVSSNGTGPCGQWIGPLFSTELSCWQRLCVCVGCVCVCVWEHVFPLLRADQYMSWLAGQCPPVIHDDNEHTLVGMKRFYSHLRFNITLYTGQSVVVCYFSSLCAICQPSHLDSSALWKQTFECCHH